MKYLTKAWYETMQFTDLHFDKRINEKVAYYDDDLFKRFYKRRENEFVKQEKEVYNVDPRDIYAPDGVSIESVLSGEYKPTVEDIILESRLTWGIELTPEDILIVEITEDEKVAIQEKIEAFDNRSPFNVEAAKRQFQQMYESDLESIKKIPEHIVDQIKDQRMFALGYCTKEIYNILKQFGKENQKYVDTVLSEYHQAQEAQNIPESILENFGFHDCLITEVIQEQDKLVLKFDTTSGFTTINKVVFVKPKIIEAASILSKYWIYHELYRVDGGYEVHILLDGDEIVEFTFLCEEIHFPKSN